MTRSPGWQVGIAIGYTLLASVLILLLFFDRVYDDPFITYRYAANLANGLGFIYNAGEHVQSTTTPLFTLLLASLTWLGGEQTPLPFVAHVIGALSLGLGGLIIWRLGHVWKTPWAGWTGLLLYPIFPLVVITLGSETPLYISLCLGTILLYTKQRYYGAAILAALAILTRPDGILIALVLAGHYLLLVRKAIPWKAVLVFLLITGAWALFAWLYFGSVLPVTLVAKQQQMNIANTERFSAGFLTVLQWFDQWPYWLALAVAILGTIAIFWKGRPWLILLLWTIIYFLGYSLLGVSRYFWYYAPLVPGFLALMGLGVEALQDTLKKAWTFLRMKQSKGIYLVPLSLIIFFILAQFVSLWNLNQLPDPRSELYQKAGDWLAKNTPTTINVGTLETGIIGYYSQRPMIDFTGLLYPDVAANIQAGSSYEDSARYVIDHYHPDVLVMQRGLYPTLEEEYVSKYCRSMITFQDQAFAYPIVIYNCQ
jgi:hypothetical protein